MQRLGILGGTFNPIHNGHLRIAAAMRQRCALDRVLFIPAATPPHKELASDVAFTDRAAMVAAAIADVDAYALSDIENRRPGKSYSVDTLRQLHESCPGTELYFLIGMDSFCDLASWREYAQIFALTHLVVAARPGVVCDDLMLRLPVAVRDEFWYDTSACELRHQSGNRVIFLPDTAVAVSSSLIRARLAAGDSITELVPAPVAAYIAAHGLYTSLE